MFRSRDWLILAAAATLSGACSRYSQSAGELGVITPEEAAKTVVLEAVNTSDESIELRVIAQNQSRFVGSVSARDTTAILLDPSLFPSGEIYVAGIAADPSHRVISGPLAATRGDKILFRISPEIRLSRAYVIH